MLLAPLAACQKDSIEVREEPKEDVPAAALAPASRPRGVHWTAPAGWTESAGNGMRIATLPPPKSGGKAEVTVIALPGDVGGERANVNRWRGQLALPPIAEADLPAARASKHSRLGAHNKNNNTGTGTNKSRLVAGMISVSGTTWFFKLMGDAPAVAAARPAFDKLLEGLKRDAP